MIFVDGLEDTAVYGLAFGISLLLTWLFITKLSKPLNTRSFAKNIYAEQAMHKFSTPRTGGLAIISALTISLGLSGHSVGSDIAWALAAAAVVFFVGLKKDLFQDVSPMTRFLAIFASAGLALLMSSTIINRLDFLGEEYLLSFSALSILITLIWSAGTCHALNQINGLNGLSSGYTMIAAAALAYMAFEAGYHDIVLVSSTLIASILGFWVFNWPYGKIFLGASGAYALGHILAWLGIFMIARGPDVSPLAVFLIFFWPVADTVFTMVRRLIYRRTVSQPDRFHSHRIIVRVVAWLNEGRLKFGAVNSVSVLIVYSLMAIPAFLGVFFWNKPLQSSVALLFCLFTFLASYSIFVDLLAARKLRRRREKTSVHAVADFPKLERSKFSGIFIEDGLAVDVIIQRMVPDGDWTLEAVADQAPGKRWPCTFSTETDAWNAFMETVSKDGMEAIVGFERRKGSDAIFSDF